MKEVLNKKVALITGATGQDGKYLAEFLLAKGYIVHGLKRRSSSFNTDRIDHLYEGPHIENRKFTLHYGDLSDSANLIRIIQEIRPDEIYNLAAQSHVQVSFEMPEFTANVDGLGALRILEAIRLLGLVDKTRVFQASSADIFGGIHSGAQMESSTFYPKSPYATAKLYAHWITVNYREAYNMYACSGILFNHESPFRGETFVTRKITQAVAKVVLGQQNRLYLGNLSAKRDWGHAKDYVEAMWKMLQQDKAEDYIIATGVTTSVRDFVKMCFSEVGIDVEFCGKGELEKGVIIDKDDSRLEDLGIDPDGIKMGQTVVKIDPKYYRPAEVEHLLGDPSKSYHKLNWRPKYTVEMLVSEMVLSDLKTLQKLRN